MSHVLDWCARQDQYSKGESPTTKAVREAYTKDALPEPLTLDEVSEIDRWMNEHMYRHSISNNINGMGCDVRCRTLALQAGINKVLKERNDIPVGTNSG